jgi:hypothetical protein
MLFSIFLTAAFFTAIFYVGPVLFPFFTPGKYKATGLTYFRWEILFFDLFHFLNYSFLKIDLISFPGLA